MVLQGLFQPLSSILTLLKVRGMAGLLNTICQVCFAVSSTEVMLNKYLLSQLID